MAMFARYGDLPSLSRGSPAGLPASPHEAGNWASVGPDPQRQLAILRRVPSPSGGARRNRFWPRSQQAKHRHALAAAPQVVLAQRLQGKAFVETGGGLAADEHDDIIRAGVDLLAELLQALGDVHRIPDERVVDAARRTDIADHRRAGVNADAQANGPQVFGAPALVVLSQRQRNR